MSFDCLHGLQADFWIKALAGSFLLALSSGPLGIFLMLRRMTLVGDALSHGILPGVALGFLVSKHGPPSLLALYGGGALSGLLLAALVVGARALMNKTQDILSEESAFAGFYLIFMAIGALLMSHHQEELVHMLFGSFSRFSSGSLWAMACTACLTLGFFAFQAKSFVMYCFDPLFFRARGGRESRMGFLFLGVLIANLLVAFQALGTLMALGLLILPAMTMRMLSQNLLTLCIGSSALGFGGSLLGLALSYRDQSLCGPMIIVILGIMYIFVLFYVALHRET